MINQYFPEKVINKKVKINNFKAVFIANYYYKNILLQKIPYIITATPFGSLLRNNYEEFGQSYVDNFVRKYKGHQFLLEINSTEMLSHMPEGIPKRCQGFVETLLSSFGIFSAYTVSDDKYFKFRLEVYKKLYQQLKAVENNIFNQIDTFGVEFPEKSESIFQGIENLRIDLEEYLDKSWWKSQEEFFVSRGLEWQYKPRYNSTYNYSREEFAEILYTYYNQKNPRGYQNITEDFVKNFLHRRYLAYLQQLFDHNFADGYKRSFGGMRPPLESVQLGFYFLKNIGEVFLEKTKENSLTGVNLGYYEFCKFFFWKAMYRKIKKIEKF